MVPVLCLSHNACVAENLDDASNTSFSGSQTLSPIIDNERHQRVGLLVKYIKQQGLGWMPGLPSAVRDPAGWAANQMRAAARGLGLNDLTADADDGVGSFFQPVSSLVEPPPPEAAEAMWLAPNYHHKGFLPFHDAIMLGFSARHSMLNNHLRFEVRPYYGQNWVSQHGYWGTEVSIDIGKELGLKRAGKIAFSYTNGAANLLDHGHGIDLHSEMQFTDHLSFNAGVRGGSDSSQIGDYALLQWKMPFSTK